MSDRQARVPHEQLLHIASAEDLVERERSEREHGQMPEKMHGIAP